VPNSRPPGSSPAGRHLVRPDFSAFRRWWTITTGLGLLFLVGQLVVWRELFAQGVFMASNPASSFFYIFTGAHALHVLGGVAALLFVAITIPLARFTDWLIARDRRQRQTAGLVG